MRLLLFSDLHADTAAARRLLALAAQADVLVGAGDFGNLRRDARFAAVPRREWDELDGLSTAGLSAVFRYQDGQTDDAALTRAVVRSAVSLGARAIVPGRFLGAERGTEGWRVSYADAGGEHACAALALVAAAEALAQAPFPARPVTLIVGFAPGRS